MTRLIGSTMILLAVAGSAFAGRGAPEIDAASGIAAIALLSGGMMVLRSRRKNRK